MFAGSLMYSPVERKATDVSPRGFAGFSMYANISICLIYNYKIILILSMILCHYVNEHTLRVTGRTEIYRYSITESLYSFTLSVRVPRFKTKRLLPGIESVVKNGPKGCLVRARIPSQETP